MFLTVHASVGAIIGEYTGDNLSAFIFGLMSHFFLDMIPHGDRKIEGIFLNNISHQKKWLAVLFVMDFITAFSLVTLMWISGVIVNPVAAYSGALGAVTPDVLSGFTVISKNKLWPEFNKFHGRIHDVLTNHKSIYIGVTLQVATLFTAWLFPFLFKF